jgi:clorobiocin biosynthesis protein CloN6
MVAANAHTTITLSPESHDREVAIRAGRGVYGNEELESWIERALDLGIGRVDLWYFIGMPGQDAASVAGTVAYCQQLMEKFHGRPVTPMICPMMPFLDPASTFFEEPEAHGYRLFARSAEDHRRLMTRASPVHRMNYETRWLDRWSIFELGLKAIRDVMRGKASQGIFSRPRVEQFAARIDDAVEFTRVVTEAEAIADPRERAREMEGLGDEIARRNETLLTGGVMDQIYPLRRQIGGRWVDELGWSEEALRAWSAKRLDSIPAG